MKSVAFEILGKKYYFKSDTPDKLLKCANHIASEVEDLNKKFNTVNQSKLFVLYSLLLTEKYFDEIEKNKNLTKEIEQINELLKHID